MARKKYDIKDFTITHTLVEMTPEERKTAKNAALHACIDMVKKYHENNAFVNKKTEEGII